ncbi:hypothetical protein Syun_004142 [Stephania yunnanensis]|uniref:Uncharacterized protein n=1 Tax=Stephania yunnanensis TaxID=152371 RepID=A0AAP0Q168_9MAGN
MDEEELPPQPVIDTNETVNADTSKSVEFDEFSIVEEHLSEPEETLDVSSHEPNITIAQYDDDEAEKEIEVISKKSEKPQKENEEDQPLVLVKPPTLPCIFVRPCKGVEVKERSRDFYTADTFVLDDYDSIDSFVLEVPNELRTLKEGMHAALPKAIDAPFVVDISKGEGITCNEYTESNNFVSDPLLIRNGSETESNNSVSEPFLISNGSEKELLFSVSIRLDPSLISNGSEMEYNNFVSDPLLIHASIP